MARATLMFCSLLVVDLCGMPCFGQPATQPSGGLLAFSAEAKDGTIHVRGRVQTPTTRFAYAHAWAAWPGGGERIVFFDVQPDGRFEGDVTSGAAFVCEGLLTVEAGVCDDPRKVLTLIASGDVAKPIDDASFRQELLVGGAAGLRRQIERAERTMREVRRLRARVVRYYAWWKRERRDVRTDVELAALRRRARSRLEDLRACTRLAFVQTGTIQFKYEVAVLELLEFVTWGRPSDHANYQMAMDDAKQMTKQLEAWIVSAKERLKKLEGTSKP